MQRTSPRVRSLALVVGCAFAFGVTAPAVAQYGGGASGGAGDARGEKKKERRWGRKKDEDAGRWAHKYTMDAYTSKRFAEALELFQAEDYEGTLQALGKLRMRSLNPFEKASVLRLRGFVA